MEFPDFVTRAMRGDYLGHAQAGKVKLAMTSDHGPHFQRASSPRRVRAIGPLGLGPWSDEASKMVP